jgi:hypothetical protein
MIKGIKLAIVVSLIFAIISIVFGGLGNGFTMRTVILYGVMGAFLGAVGAPEIEPKYFRYPTIWQVFFSIVGCSLFAFSMHAPLEGYVAAVLIGGFLGFTAHYWVKHVSFP